MAILLLRSQGPLPGGHSGMLEGSNGALTAGGKFGLDHQKPSLS
jgi:hypothetical protein